MTKQINIEKNLVEKNILKTENLGKNELAATARQRLSNANKKPSKNHKKPSAAPGNFEKPSKSPPAAP